MADVKAPQVQSYVVGRNRLVLQAIDREIFETVEGTYLAEDYQRDKQCYAKLTQDRAKDVFEGWMIATSQYFSEIPVNGELWNIFGKLDYSNMSLRGSIQRISSAGNLLGRMLFTGEVKPTSIDLQIESIGLFVFRPIVKDIVKPAIRQ